MNVDWDEVRRDWRYRDGDLIYIRGEWLRVRYINEQPGYTYEVIADAPSHMAPTGS